MDRSLTAVRQEACGPIGIHQPTTMLPIKAGIPVARGRRDVKYNEGAQLDPSQMGGGRGSGGKIAIGGGAGLIVLLLALLFGINPGDILGGTQQAGPEESTNPSPFAQCTRGSDINTQRDCRFVAYTNSIQDYWNDNLQGYQTIKVQTFTGSINTACGNATSAVGPFYCPADTTVYLDLGFFDQLTANSGRKAAMPPRRTCWRTSSGIVQNLVGTMQRVQSSGQRTDPRRQRSGSSCRPIVTRAHGSGTRRRIRRARSARSPRRISTEQWTQRRRWATTASRRRCKARSRRKAGPMVRPQCDVSGLRRASIPAIRTSATHSPGTP